MGRNIAVDFDGTLVEYNGKHVQDVYGNLLPNAKEFVLKLLERGHRVTIFTARSNHAKIAEWLMQQGLPKLKVTNIKSGFDLFIDDRSLAFPGASFYNNIDDAINTVESFKPWWQR